MQDIFLPGIYFPNFLGWIVYQIVLPMVLRLGSAKRIKESGAFKVKHHSNIQPEDIQKFYEVDVLVKNDLLRFSVSTCLI